MQVLGQRGVGLACVAFFVLAAMPVGSQVTTDAGISITALSPSDRGLSIGQTQMLSFDLTNDADAAAEEVRLFVPDGAELVEFLGATVDVAGWTTALSDASPTDGIEERAVLTGALAADQTIRITLELRVLANTDDGDQQALSVLLIDTTPNPDVTLGTGSIPLSFHTSRVTASPSAVLLEEGGESETVSVSVTDLGDAASATVTVSSSDPTLFTVTPATLEFTQTGASQTVTIAPTAGDNVDTGTQQLALNLRYNDLPLAAGRAVPVFLQDDDEAAIVLTEQGDATIVYEGSDTDSFTVRLATRPTANVALTLGITPTGQATLDKTTLTFTPADWHTPQQVKVTAVDDGVTEALVTTAQINVGVTSTATRGDGYDLVEARSVSLSVVDNEGVDVIVEQSDGFSRVTEALGNRSDDFTVVLARQPLEPVTIDVTLGTASQGTATTPPDLTVLPAALTFTPSNWLVPQQVVMTAVNDTLGEGTEIASVDVAVRAGSSPEYLKVPKRTVSVTIVDDDVRGVVPTITSTAKATSETAASANEVKVAVKLSVRPAGSVNITVTSSDTSEIVVKSGATIRFTDSATDWDTAKEVVLAGVDDDLYDGHQLVNITFSVDDDSHPLWRVLDDFVLPVTNRDNEHTVMVRPTALALDEGQEGSYELSLTRAPASGQTVKVVVEPSSGLQVASETAQSGNTTDRILLSFSAADTPQTVHVTAIDDALATGARTLRVSHTATSGHGAFHGVPVEDVVVTVADDERFDVAAANTALQQTVTVDRRSGDNHVSWDIEAAGGDPAGVQVWRSSSPFAIVATLDNQTAEFRDGTYRDRDGRAGDHYIVTVFYGPTSDEGRFPPNTPLSLVPGYLGLSLAEQQGLAGVAAAADGLSTGTWIAIVAVAAILLVLVIVLIVAASRRKKTPEDTLDWDEPVEAWQPPPPAVDEPTYHLTCPRCEKDFDATGHKPLVTNCPHCGVEGVLN